MIVDEQIETGELENGRGHVRALGSQGADLHDSTLARSRGLSASECQRQCGAIPAICIVVLNKFSGAG